VEEDQDVLRRGEGADPSHVSGLGQRAKWHWLRLVDKRFELEESLA
jgi:hypothetical protein